MAFIDVPGYPMSFPTAGAGSFPSGQFHTIDADGEKVAFILQVPKTGNLKRAWFSCDTVAQAPTNGLKVSFQDVDTSANPRAPDGTVDQYRNVPSGDIATDTGVITGIMSSDGTDTGSLRAVTQGDFVCVVIEFESWATGDDVDICDYSIGPYTWSSSLLGFPGSRIYTGGSWGVAVQSQGNLNIGLQYDDDVWYPIFGCIPRNGNVNTTYSIGSATTPDELGVKFTCPFPMRVIGCWYAGYAGGATGGWDVILYDSDSNSLASVNMRQELWNNSGRRASAWIFDDTTGVELSTNAVYRLVCKAVGFVTGSLYGLDVVSGLESAAPWGENGQLTYRTDGGSWTDESSWDALGGTQVGVPGLGLIVDAIDPVKGVSLPTQFLTPSIFNHMRIVNR